MDCLAHDLIVSKILATVGLIAILGFAGFALYVLRFPSGNRLNNKEK